MRISTNLPSEKFWRYRPSIEAIYLSTPSIILSVGGLRLNYVNELLCYTCWLNTRLMNAWCRSDGSLNVKIISGCFRVWPFLLFSSTNSRNVVRASLKSLSSWALTDETILRHSGRPWIRQICCSTGLIDSWLLVGSWEFCDCLTATFGRLNAELQKLEVIKGLFWTLALAAAKVCFLMNVIRVSKSYGYHVLPPSTVVLEP